MLNLYKVSEVLGKCYRVVFFDFDGVIKESSTIKSTAYEELFQSFGSDVVRRIREHHSLNPGVSRFEKIPLYMEWSELVVSEVTRKDWLDNYGALVKNRVIASEWTPGIKELLGSCRECIFFVVSATPECEMREIVDALEISNFFSGVYGSPATKSELLANILSEFCLKASECVLVGDSYSDYTAANANNIDFVFRAHKDNQDVVAKGFKKIIYDFN